MDNFNSTYTNTNVPQQNQNVGGNKKLRNILSIILVVLIIALSVWVYVFYSNTQEVAQEEPKSEVAIEQVSPDKLPEKFPADIPLESGAKIMQNYNATAPDGRVQATRTFESKKTLDENFEIYKTAFSKNDWVISNTVEDQSNVKAIFASKDNDSVRGQVIIRENAPTQTRIVDVSITFFP